MSAYPQVQYVTASELRLMLNQKQNKFPGFEDIEIIDVRDDDRAEGGHIPGSRWVPSRQFRQRLPELVEQYKTVNKTLVFHCMFSQSRGPSCARLFAEAAGKQEDVATVCKVRILRGGFIGWETECPDYIEQKNETEGPRKFFVFEDDERNIEKADTAEGNG